MPQYFHKFLASGRWFKLSLAEQMGNIGSEVARAASWSKRDKKDEAKKAIDRALELFNLTLADPRWKNRLKELARGREVLTDTFYGDNFYKTSLDDLDKYFYYFAYYARVKKLTT